MFSNCGSRTALETFYVLIACQKFVKLGIAKKRRQLNHIISEILLEGNSNLNSEPDVAHKTSELVESYRSPEKTHNIVL